MTDIAPTNDRNTAVFTSFGIYGLSLALPGINCAGAHVAGWKILAYGWFGAFALDFAWYANPLYLAAAVFLLAGWYRTARVLTWAAVLVACLAFFTKNWYFNESYPSPITSLGIGFYVWLASFLVLLGGAETKNGDDHLAAAA
jgi:hypothetical protein